MAELKFEACARVQGLGFEKTIFNFKKEVIRDEESLVDALWSAF